jgi:hypothetical protein
MGYLRCFGSPNAELGSLLRVADFSLAIGMHEDIELSNPLSLDGADAL